VPATLKCKIAKHLCDLICFHPQVSLVDDVVVVVVVVVVAAVVVCTQVCNCRNSL